MNALSHLYSAVGIVFAPFGNFFIGTAHAAAPHSGITDRPGIELSDIALFAFAALGLWFARRSMRARARARKALAKD